MTWQFHHQTHQVAQLFRIDISNTSDQDKVRALVQSESRIVQLRNKLNTLRDMAREVLKDDDSNGNEGEPKTVHAMGNINTKEFKIDQGSNDSMHTKEPFAESRIQEILSKIEIGDDLSEEQKGHVQSLICEYADVFTLSLSEV
jgi:Mg2+ and Co2+ transporter CorA